MTWLRLWIGLLVLQAALAPARADDAIVRYGERQPIPVGTMPLSVAVEGWSKPDFKQAWREAGTVGSEGVPTITRYEASFAHGGYFGAILFVDTTRDAQWKAPTPSATLKEWGYFRGRPVIPGATGQVVNGKMTIDYLLAQVTGTETAACALFSGAAERAQMRGFLCAPQAVPLDGAPAFIGAIGHPGLFAPVAAALPPVRTTP
jgi:hypothetical protein